MSTSGFTEEFVQDFVTNWCRSLTDTSASVWPCCDWVVRTLSV